MKNYLVFFSVLLSFGVFAAESYPELMDQAEKLMNRRYEKGTRAYKIKSAELDEILESKETREEKIARLKKFIAEFQPAQTVQTSGAAVSKEQIWQYLKDIRQCEKEAENGDSHFFNFLCLFEQSCRNAVINHIIAKITETFCQKTLPVAVLEQNFS